MKIEYNNLYIHFVFTTFNRLPVIPEKNRQRIEKTKQNKVIRFNVCAVNHFY